MIGSCIAAVVALFLAGACFQDFLNSRRLKDLLWAVVGVVIGLFFLLVVIGKAASTAGVMYAV